MPTWLLMVFMPPPTLGSTRRTWPLLTTLRKNNTSAFMGYGAVMAVIMQDNAFLSATGTGAGALTAYGIMREIFKGPGHDNDKMLGMNDADYSICITTWSPIDQATFGYMNWRREGVVSGVLCMVFSKEYGVKNWA